MRQLTRTLIFFALLFAVICTTDCFVFPSHTDSVSINGSTYYKTETGFQPLALLGLLLLIPLVAWHIYTYTIEDDFEIYF